MATCLIWPSIYLLIHFSKSLPKRLSIYVLVWHYGCHRRLSQDSELVNSSISSWGSYGYKLFGQIIRLGLIICLGRIIRLGWIVRLGWILHLDRISAWYGQSDFFTHNSYSSIHRSLDKFNDMESNREVERIQKGYLPSTKFSTNLRPKSLVFEAPRGNET